MPFTVIYADIAIPFTSLNEIAIYLGHIGMPWQEAGLCLAEMQKHGHKRAHIGVAKTLLFTD
jgi:hypothetical protein